LDLAAMQDPSALDLAAMQDPSALGLLGSDSHVRPNRLV